MDDEWIVVNGATVVDQRGDEHAVVAHVAYYDDGPSDGPTWGGRVEGLSLDVAHGLLTLAIHGAGDERVGLEMR